MLRGDAAATRIRLSKMAASTGSTGGDSPLPVTGEIVTETLDYDAGRDVTAYVPPGPPEAVVFAGDGQLVSQWGAAVLGVSASGELALAMGLRHPDIYGAVFCGSPGGGYRPPDLMPSPLPRTYLVAGTDEPFFLKNAARWAGALRNAGADVVMTERAGSHGDPFWQEELPLMVAWAFGR